MMRTPWFSSDTLARFLQTKQIATLPEWLRVLATDVPLTVFGKLKELSSHASYSHRGRFYTLDAVARFDQQGLWSHGPVCFSRFGTL